MPMNRADCLGLIETAEIGHLATIRPDGAPHLVPITFAVVRGRLAHMVDHKPKTTSRLQRLANVSANPMVSFMVDHYEGEWDRLWWVRVDGAARVVTDGSDWDESRAALVSKYLQYRTTPPTGPAMLIEMETVSGWAASDRFR